MFRSLRMFWQFQLASWKQQLAYPSVFWFGVVAKALRLGVMFIAFSALTSAAVSLGGFAQWDVYVHMLTSMVSVLIVSSFFQRNLLHRLSGLIRKGDLDLVLVKPISPLFHVAVSVGDLFDLVTLIPMVGLLVWALTRVEGLTAGRLTLYVVGLFVGIVLMAGLTVLFSATLFKVVQGSGITRMMREATRATQYPVTAFGPVVSTIFLFFVPFGFVATVPVGLLVGLFSRRMLVFAVCASALLMFLSVRVWNWALNHVYSSASS